MLEIGIGVTILFVMLAGFVIVKYQELREYRQVIKSLRSLISDKWQIDEIPYADLNCIKLVAPDNKKVYCLKDAVRRQELIDLELPILEDKSISTTKYNVGEWR